MLRRSLASTGFLLATLVVLAFVGAAAASAESTVSLQSASAQARGVVVALDLRFTCDPGSGEIGLYATVSQRQGSETVTGAAVGGFYYSEHITCSGAPQSKVMYLPADAGFYKSGEASFEVYLYTCCTTASVITTARIIKQTAPPLNAPARGSFITAADTGQLAANGAEVIVPFSYRCSGPVLASQILAALVQRVGQVKVDGNPFFSGPFEIVCDGSDHAASVSFSAPTGTRYVAEDAFLTVELEVYDGETTYTAREYRTVHLTK